MKLFKSKVFYIVLIVIFTLILLATLIIRFAVPSGRSSSGFGPGNGTPPNFDSSQDFGNFPDFPGNGGERPDFGSDSDFSMPSDFTPPEGFDMPSDFERPSDSKDRDSEDADTDSDSDSDNDSSDRKMPGGFDPDSFPQGMPGSRGGRSGGFVGTVKKIWIPVSVVCVLVDAFAVFMLIRISKKKGSDDSTSGAAGGDSDKEDDRKSKKPLLFLLLIPVIVVAIVLKMIPAGGSGVTSSIEVKENVITAEAASKVLNKVFLSGGSLSEEDSVSFTLPGDVKIISYAVSNGDMVEEGDLIAKVNKTSVMTSISDIRDLIADLDETLAKNADEEDYKKIKSPAAGRVKAIYAEKGTSISDTMANNGALILLSLDGLMKVDIDPKAGLSVGDTVVVRLSDFTEKKGRVAQVTEDKVTVTLTDKKTELGDKATVLTEDGNTLGTGELEINSCLKITGYQGITGKVFVEVGDYVEADDDLIKLTRTVHSTDYSKLTSQRETLTEQLNTLFEIYKTGEIRAEKSGIIQGLDEDIGTETEEETEIKEKNSSAVFYYDPVVPVVTEDEEDTEPTQPADTNDKKDNKDSGDKTQPTEPSSKTDPTDPAKTDPTNPSDNSKPTDATQPGNTSDPTQATGQDQTKPSGNFPSGDFPSGEMPTGSDGTTDIAADQTDTATSYSTDSYTVSETEIYQIKPQDKMSIDISVDELDIGAVKVGEDVIVSLDALPGQSFDGRIVSIGSEGTYDSGNTKYTVSIELDRTEQMYQGMNAGIKIARSDDSEYLTVPVAALIDEGGKTYVYTGYDEETDELTGLTEVTTGLSDGENVEIVSGINSGDKVCYRYADTIEYNFTRKL